MVIFFYCNCNCFSTATSPNTINLSCWDKMSLFIGLFTYIFLPISTSVLNLYYILYNYFQKKEIFGTVMAFYLYPSLFSLAVILLVYKACPGFLLCSFIPNLCSTNSTNNNKNTSTTNNNNNKRIGRIVMTRTEFEHIEQHDDEEAEMKNNKNDIKGSHTITNTNGSNNNNNNNRNNNNNNKISDSSNITEHENEEDEDDHYDNCVKLIPVLIGYVIHIPFYAFWIAVGYFLVLSKAIVIGKSVFCI